MNITGQSTTTKPVERLLAILGAVLCLSVTIALWVGLSTNQTMLPLPGLYFIEMVVISIISAFAFIRVIPGGKIILWSTVGAISGFSILGALSVGVIYLPVVLIFVVISITSDVRNKERIASHLVVCLFAGFAQAATMLAAIRLLYPSAVF